MLFAAIGSIVARTTLVPQVEATTGALQYITNMNLTRSGMYKLMPFINGAAAGGADRLSAFVYSVLPDVPAAKSSSVNTNGVVLHFSDSPNPTQILLHQYMSVFDAFRIWHHLMPY